MTEAATAPYTRTLAEFALGVDVRQLPEGDKHEALRIFLDCLGCAVAGLTTPAGKIAVDLVKGERGPLQAKVIGDGRASLMPAAFANAVMINALDFDPTGPEGHAHPAAVSTALGLADAVEAPGSELLSGIVAGLEVAARLGGAYRRSGEGGARQAAPTLGNSHFVFAAVAAAGRILRLSPDQMHHAFGVGGYSAVVPTFRKFMASAGPAMTKYDFLGLMARNGIQAVLLAQRGFTGDLEVLEGDTGFWRFSGAAGCAWDYITHDLGTHWTFPGVRYKPYPVGLFTAPAVGLVRQMVQENGLSLDSIEHIEVRGGRGGERRPPEEIRDSLEAWHHQPYNIAVGLYDIHPWRAWQQPQSFQRSDILRLAKRIEFRPFQEGEITARGREEEGWSPVRLTIRAGGRTYEGAEDYLPKMSDQELAAKFQDNVSGLIPAEKANELEKLCWNLLMVENTRQLTDLLPSQPSEGS